MNLIKIEDYKNSKQILYELLIERENESDINISHKELPSYEFHCSFVDNHPYQCWYLIQVDNNFVGSIYLTQKPKSSIAGNEIGIFIFNKYKRNGYAKEAIIKIMNKYKHKRFLANINPANTKSIKLFEDLGFKLCQYTFEKEQ